jgi:predicted nucleotidyltransferase
VNPTRERAIEELRQMLLAALGEHDAEVWLFGSCARGGAFRHSDIDIAILPRDDLPFGFFGVLQADIEESTIPYDVDLVDHVPGRNRRGNRSASRRTCRPVAALAEALQRHAAEE